MGCIVNGPGECEGADVAIFAGSGKGIIYVQGRRRRVVAENHMLDALLEECRMLADQVRRGQVHLMSQDDDSLAGGLPTSSRPEEPL